MVNLLQGIEIATKWRAARTSVYRLYTALDTDGSGEAKYRERMKLLQGYIKACMELHKLEVVEAIIHLGNECGDDGILAVQVLAAGYDLTEGIDYTIVKDEKETGTTKDSSATAEG